MGEKDNVNRRIKNTTMNSTKKPITALMTTSNGLYFTILLILLAIH